MSGGLRSLLARWIGGAVAPPVTAIIVTAPPPERLGRVQHENRFARVEHEHRIAKIAAENRIGKVQP